MIESPLVSVVIPNYNKAAYVRQTVESVLRQGVPVEAIVVDDGSTDEGPAILARLADADARVRLVLTSGRRGGSACRNEGLRLARAAHVMFVDSDDLLAPHCCGSRLAAVAGSPDHDLWVFPMEVFRHSPDAPFDRWVPRPGNHLAHFLAHRLDWHTMQPLWRTAFIRGIGGFDERFPRLQDPEVHASAMLAGARVATFADVRPDCMYRVDLSRHGADASRLAALHADAATLFHAKFLDRVGPELRPMLSGTLLATLSMLEGMHRRKLVPYQEARLLCTRVLNCCAIPSHRAIMTAFVEASLRFPWHIPGLRLAAQGMMGLPR